MAMNKLSSMQISVISEWFENNDFDLKVLDYIQIMMNNLDEPELDDIEKWLEDNV